MFLSLEPDVVALTGCTRASLGIFASSSGGLAGLLLFKVECNVSPCLLLYI